VKPIIFHDDAQAEFDAAIAYYEMRETGLGLRLYRDVERAAKLVNQYPQIGCQYKSTEFRRYVIGRFHIASSILNCRTRSGSPPSRPTRADRITGRGGNLTASEIVLVSILLSNQSQP
jgi:hypothetical protein